MDIIVFNKHTNNIINANQKRPLRAAAREAQQRLVGNFTSQDFVTLL